MNSDLNTAKGFLIGGIISCLMWYGLWAYVS